MVPLSILDLAFVPEGATPAEALERTLDLGAACRSVGLPAVLARRAPQHGRRRERGDLDRHRLCCRGHAHDSRRRRRHHAAESLAARHRRAVRHARVACIPAASISVSAARPARIFRTLRALRRSTVERRHLSRRRARAEAAVRPVAAEPNRAGRAGHRVSTCRSGSWARASTARSSRQRWVCRTRSRRTSRPVISTRRSRLYRAQFRPSAQLAAPYAMVGVNAVVAEYGRRSAPAVHDGTTGVHEPLARCARPFAAAARRHRRVLDAAGAGARHAHVVVLVRRFAGDGARAAVAFHGAHTGRRADRGRGDLRSGRASDVLRAAGRGCAGLASDMDAVPFLV